MHGNLLNKNKSKMFLTANSDLAARISILENNVYKVTYYEIISGASGTLTVPTGATINSGEFSGANCVLSEIDGSNKPTFVTPLDGGGTPVTSTLNVGTGAWVKSGVTVSTNVALIYSVDITAALYQNLNNFYIIDNVLISSLSQVLTNSGTASTLSSELSRVISDETGSGSLVFGTSPTFTTNITTPLIIGGTAVGSTIQYKGTTGIGTSTVAAHQFLVGTNGGTTAASIYNSGQVNIGNYATPSAQRLVTIGQDTAFMSLGSWVGLTGNPAIYMGQATPDSINYTLATSGSSTYLNAPTNGTVNVAVASSNKFSINNAGVTFTFTAQPSGAITNYNLNIGAHTGQTASTEIPNFKVNGASKTWLAGAIATQRWNYLTANTAAFASASTIAESYGLYVEAATAGSNATITNNFALGLLAGTATIKMGNLTGTTTDPAIYLNQATPSNTNYSIYASTVTTALNGAATGVTLQVAGQEKILIYGLRTSGSASNYNFSTLNNTGMTASTEIPGYLYNSYSRQWATGNITTQREIWHKTVTYTAVGASVITTAYGAYFEAPTAGTNVTITNNWAAGFLGNVWIGYDASNYLSTTVASTGEVTNTLVGTTKTFNISSSGSTVIKVNSSAVITYIGTDGGGGYVGTNTAHAFRVYSANVQRLSFAGSGTGDCTVTDALNFILGSTTGHKFGTATTQKLAFWNATPIVQPSGAAQAALAAYATGAFGLDSNANMQAMYDLVMAMRTVLVNTGLMKGAA